MSSGLASLRTLPHKLESGRWDIVRKCLSTEAATCVQGSPNVSHRTSQQGPRVSRTPQRYQRHKKLSLPNTLPLSTRAQMPDGNLVYPSFEERLNELSRQKINRTLMIERVQQVIDKHFGTKYIVEPFGSTCYGAGRASSDVDLCVFDPAHPNGFQTAKEYKQRPPIYDVQSLARIFEAEGYRDVDYVAKAAVPIVKLTDPVTGISSDLNINNRLGVYNTRLLRQYCQTFRPLAPLLRKIKNWATHVDLNSPSPTKGQPRSFSSYALTLMTVALFQSKRLLPNLQRDRDPVIDRHHWVFQWDGAHSAYISVDIRWGKASRWRPPENYHVLGGLRAWFKYWGYQHNYRSEEVVVSMRDGGLVKMDAATVLPPALFGINQKKSDRELRLIVLDPFIPKVSPWRTCQGSLAGLSLLHHAH
ncbi:hypothetical protein C8Q80DRAFT_1177066 [Daedaleopsis nitida]|nr:hypothetical protein C8Q80DRAFT_1177066 [Daedaleopsis nitida]